MTSLLPGSGAAATAAALDLPKPKRITKAYEVKHAETGTAFSRSAVLSSAIDAPGRHEALDPAVDGALSNPGATSACVRMCAPKYIVWLE